MAEVNVQETTLRERSEEEARLAQVSEEIRSGRRSAGVCDKCGCSVPSGNDATIIAFLLGDIFAMFATPRHLLPVVENGETVCEGSPSRAQYLPDQPRDPRLSYAYRPEWEEKYRAAYEQLQREAAAQNAHLN